MAHFKKRNDHGSHNPRPVEDTDIFEIYKIEYKDAAGKIHQGEFEFTDNVSISSDDKINYRCKTGDTVKIILDPQKPEEYIDLTEQYEGLIAR